MKTPHIEIAPTNKLTITLNINFGHYLRLQDEDIAQVLEEVLIGIRNSDLDLVEAIAQIPYVATAKLDGNKVTSQVWD